MSVFVCVLLIVCLCVCVCVFVCQGNCVILVYFRDDDLLAAYVRMITKSCVTWSGFIADSVYRGPDCGPCPDVLHLLSQNVWR